MICKDENSLLPILTAISRYYYLPNMYGNLCNTNAILNQVLAYLHLEWYNLYCAFKNTTYMLSKSEKNMNYHYWSHMILNATFLLPIHYSVLMFVYLRHILVLRMHILVLRIHILIHVSRSFHSLISKSSVKLSYNISIFTDLMASNILFMNFS